MQKLDLSEKDRQQENEWSKQKILWREAYLLLKMQRTDINQRLNEMTKADSDDMRVRLNTVIKNRKARR